MRIGELHESVGGTINYYGGTSCALGDNIKACFRIPFNLHQYSYLLLFI
jgi:hypothetical protein